MVQDNLINKDNDHTSQLKSNRGPDMRTLWFYPVYDLDGTLLGWDCICLWPQDNCLPTVIINGNPGGTTSMTSNLRLAYEDFIQKFNSGNVDEFFINGDYQTLFPNLANMSDVLIGLQRAEIELHYNLGTDGLDYYIGLTTGVEFLSEWQESPQVTFVIDTRLND